ncbi:MAG TPA: YibE/F family protein [Acidimicrobiales bacterium]|nr:YibE/F family protein [Acidimicrobiales bacterium]
MTRTFAVERLLLTAVVPLLLATVAGLVALWPDGDVVERPGSFGPPVQLVNGTVTTDRVVPCKGSPIGAGTQCRVATVHLTAGPEKGGTTDLELFEGPGQPRLRPGDRVVLGRAVDRVGVDYYFSDFQRRSPLLWLGLIFAVAVVAVGRLRGLAALVGLGLSFVLLIAFVLPAILEGSNPLLVAIVGSSAIMFVLMYLAHGVNPKTTTALVGTLVSLALTGILAALFVGVARVAEVTTEETAYLQISASQVSLEGILLGGIIIGSLGVLNDVTVTQASAVWALRDSDPKAGALDLYRRAMRIGRDHIASTVDTLVLAYAGASLPLLLLFTLASRPIGDVVTGGLVAQEIVRTLVGGIGLVASVPVTTGLAALVATRGGGIAGKPGHHPH